MRTVARDLEGGIEGVGAVHGVGEEGLDGGRAEIVGLAEVGGEEACRAKECGGDTNRRGE